jgi:hypothetical protein
MRKVEYIESSGQQHINTNIAGNTIGKIVAEISFEASVQSWGCAFACTSSYYTGYDFCGITYDQGQNKISFRYGNPANSISALNTLVLHQKYLFDCRKGNEFYIDKVLQGTVATSGVTDRPLWICANNTPQGKQQSVSIRIYSFKIYDTSGVLVRDFIPVLDENDEACLYDQVSGTYFRNAGGGAFTAGAVIVTEKYLIESGGNYYSIENDVLTNVGSTLNAQLFLDHGMDTIPDWDDYSSLVSPSMLCWNRDEEVDMLAAVVGVPYPQTVVSESIDMTRPQITSIEGITAEYEGSPVFAVSPDNGTTWKMWNGSQWVTLSDPASGMSGSVMADISTSNWANLGNNIQKLKVRFTLQSASDKVTSVVVDFTH